MRQRKKRIPSLQVLISLAVCALLLSGCLDPVQLNQRAIVQATGIDLEDDGQLKLTLQVFSPATSGGGSISATADNAKIIEARGATISEAIQNATLLQGKQLFIGHNRIIITGTGLAKRDMEQCLSYFASSPASRQNVHLAVAENRADEILKARINQGMLPAEALEKIVENTEENGMMKSVKLFEFLKALENKHEASILPVMTVTKPEPAGSGGGEKAGESGEGGAPKESGQLDEVSSLSIVGTAVFDGPSMAGILERDESRGLLWIRGDVEHTILTVSTQKFETAALRVYSSRSKLIPDLSSDRLAFRLEVHCKAAVGETILRTGQTADPSDLDELARAGEAMIKTECQKAFRKAAWLYGADVFNFGNLVWQKDAELWRTLRGDWQEHLDEVQFQAEAKIDLDRVGTEFKQTDRPHEEDRLAAEEGPA